MADRKSALLVTKDGHLSPVMVVPSPCSWIERVHYPALDPGADPDRLAKLDVIPQRFVLSATEGGDFLIYEEQ